MFWHFTVQPRYFSAVDEIREPHAARTIEQSAIDARAGLTRKSGHRNGPIEGYRERSCTPPPNPLGKLPGSVWTIPTEPLRVPDHLGIDHFAAFPTEWPRRIIQGWSPREVCTACGEGRRPVTAREALSSQGSTLRGTRGTSQLRGVARAESAHQRDVVTTITGYACACPDPSAPTTPGKVLDPFGGTGTTALVADVLGRDGITVDLSADYCRLTQWRTTDPAQRAKAARVDVPPPLLDGQMALFDE